MLPLPLIRLFFLIQCFLQCDSLDARCIVAKKETPPSLMFENVTRWLHADLHEEPQTKMIFPGLCLFTDVWQYDLLDVREIS